VFVELEIATRRYDCKKRSFIRQAPVVKLAEEQAKALIGDKMLVNMFIRLLLAICFFLKCFQLEVPIAVMVKCKAKDIHRFFEFNLITIYVDLYTLDQ
jgi:hypothetical protein